MSANSVPSFTNHNPYKNFKLRVKWEGRYVMGLSKMSPLKRTTEVIDWRDGTHPNMIRKLPGKTTIDPVTLERGITHDVEFENWVSWSKVEGPVNLENYKRNIIINVYDEEEKLIACYKLYGCWVSEYQTVVGLHDADSNALFIEHIKLEIDGWERDENTVEPKEPNES